MILIIWMKRGLRSGFRNFIQKSPKPRKLSTKRLLSCLVHSKSLTGWLVNCDSVNIFLSKMSLKRLNTTKRNSVLRRRLCKVKRTFTIVVYNRIYIQTSKKRVSKVKSARSVKSIYPRLKRKYH